MKKALSIVFTLVLLLVVSVLKADAKGIIGEGFSDAEPGTVGYYIAGEWYGNVSNPSGNGEGVLPSWSPGPWVCGNNGNGCAGPTDNGASVGEIFSYLASGGHSKSEFANGNDQDIDFSAH